MLAEDDEIRVNGTGSETGRQAIAKQLAEAGIQPAAGYTRAGPPPEYGLSPREMLQRAQTLDWTIPAAELALAMGNIASLDEDDLHNLLATFGLSLDRKSQAFRELGLALLKKRVEAQHAIADRMMGQPIENERRLVDLFTSVLRDINPTLARGRLLKPVTMSLFGMINWSYLWFRSGGLMSRLAYADLVTQIMVDGIARLGADGPTRTPPALQDTDLADPTSATLLRDRPPAKSDRGFPNTRGYDLLLVPMGR